MQNPCTTTDIEKHLIIGCALAGLTCFALAAIGTAHEKAESLDTFAPIRVDHIAAQLRYAPSRQSDRAESLALAFPSVASAPAAKVMRAAGARDGEGDN